MNLMAIELAQKGINWRANMHRLTWSASLVALAFMPIEGHALGLGRVNVLSALGSPLKAEIDITSISPSEASSLKAKIASQEVYRSAGLDFNQVLSNVSITLEQRPSGKQFLRITSGSTVTEPFVDAILDIKWSSGQLVREYTMLFDPPDLVATTTRVQEAPSPAVTPVMMDAPPSLPQRAASSAPSNASDGLADIGDDDMVDGADAAPPATPVRAATTKSGSAVTLKKPAPTAVATAPAPKAETKTAPLKKPAVEAKPPAPAEAKNQASSTSVKTIAVKAGDTLSSLAEKHRTEGVSLDQMIVSLYRNNTNAFFGDNLNRMKSGVVLKVPEAEVSQLTSSADARRLIVAQSADFEAFRQRLAGATTTRVPAVAKQQVTGTVETEVKDQQAIQAAMPNKLTLSKGGMKPSEADSIAKSRAQAESASRVTELSRNLDDLEKIKEQVIQAKPTEKTEASGPLVASSQTLAEPAKPMEEPADSKTAASSASVSETTDLAPMEAAPEPAPIPAPAPVQVAEPEPEPVGPTLAERFNGLTRQLHINPGVIAGAVSLLALLGAGFLFWRSRRKSDASETSFLESRLQPDSFFGASGGQRVDTRDAAGPSSMSYSLSQLDAIGDVDPLAEADVYLAYGRDLQAEEILKEALRSTPERLPIHTKLMEVYAKRRDSKAVEQVAKGLFGLTNGEGPDWSRAKELGLSVDPGNPLYKTAAVAMAMADESGGIVQDGPAVAAVDQTAPLVRSRSVSEQRDPIQSDAQDSAFGDIDLDISLPPTPEMLGQAATEPMALSESRQPDQRLIDAKASESSDALDFEFDIDIDADEAIVKKPQAVPAAATPMPEFDLSSISLDLDDEPAEKASSSELSLPVADTMPAELDVRVPLTAEMVNDPMQRKLELAQEFMQIGDADGARELLTEVATGGKPETIAKARLLLDKLS